MHGDTTLFRFVCYGCEGINLILVWDCVEDFREAPSSDAAHDAARKVSDNAPEYDFFVRPVLCDSEEEEAVIEALRAVHDEDGMPNSQVTILVCENTKCYTLVAKMLHDNGATIVRPPDQTIH